MDTNLVVEGFKFLALGMGTVFLFLVVLIVMINIMSDVIHRFFPEPTPSTPVANAGTQKNDNKIVAAITAAIAHHRKG